MELNCRIGVSESIMVALSEISNAIPGTSYSHGDENDQYLVEFIQLQDREQSEYEKVGMIVHWSEFQDYTPQRTDRGDGKKLQKN